MLKQRDLLTKEHDTFIDEMHHPIPNLLSLGVMKDLMDRKLSTLFVQVLVFIVHVFIVHVFIVHVLIVHVFIVHVFIVNVRLGARCWSDEFQCLSSRFGLCSENYNSMSFCQAVSSC